MTEELLNDESSAEDTAENTNSNKEESTMSQDAKEIGDILTEVSDKIPKMIGGIMSQFYSPEAGKNMGQAVGNFYKELIAAGIPEEEAKEMAKDYMISIKKIFNDAMNSEKQ